MTRFILLSLFGLLVIGCSKPMPPEPQVKVAMQIKSASFFNTGPIPAKYTGYGAGVSPQLSWSAPPEGTKSLVLLVEDPDAPGPQPFVHWLIYNIPATTSSIPEGQPPAGSMLGKNDGGSTAYYGPRPPSGVHHYYFRLYAVDRQVDLPAGAGKDKVLQAINGHTLGRAEMVGIVSH